MKRGFVRIIAGKWRGRLIKIPSVKDLRPTPDRVRETLFNWLSKKIPGAICLDAFAGTGVLGLEALSRGAKSVMFVDKTKAVIDNLLAVMATLKIENATVCLADFPKGLSIAEPFDIVFLDPPYQNHLLMPICQFLEAQKWLKPNALVYAETGAAIQQQLLPKNWTILKSGHAGQVFYYLLSPQDDYE